MTSELSILIPCHNYICTPLVEQLARQASSVKGLRYEIVVIDDGSTEANMVKVTVHGLPDGRFSVRYIEALGNDVVDGGIRIEGDASLLRCNLRFIYEKSFFASI